MTDVRFDSPADNRYQPTLNERTGHAMSDEEVQSAVAEMTQLAKTYVDTELSVWRAEAEKYYKGELFDNEEDGRSQVVMTEVRDAILMILPSLIKMFFGAEPAVEYGPSSAKQVPMAEQVTKFVLDVILQTDNEGFLVFHSWFKDALTKRLGVVKYWQDDSKETRSFSASYLSAEQVTLIMQDESIDVDDVAVTPNAPAGLYDVEYTQHRQWSRTRVLCIPPEEYLFSRGARTSSNDPAAAGVALFVGHQTQLTRSQLVAMGVSEEDIDEFGGKDTSLDANPEEIARQDTVKDDAASIGPLVTRTHLYIEGYPYLDLDGDGVAELVQVNMLGPSYHVIGEPSPCARRPFAVLTPDPTPHVVIGQCTSDYTMDLQKIVSMVWRSINDSLVLTLNQRIGYIEGEASLEDILNMELGAPIRMRSAGALQPIEHNFVGAAGLQVLDALATVKENRIGVTRASAGLDSSALQSSSAAAVSASVTNAQQHIEMIARIFAETGVKQLFRGILELVVENPDEKRMVRVNDEYVEMDPRAWEASLDVRINVAIGAGTLQEKLMTLQDVATRMEALMQTMGPANPLFNLHEYREVLVKMLKLRGRMDAAAFFKPVDPNWAPPPPEPPGANDPNMVIAQAEATKAAAEVQAKAATAQLNVQKHEVELQARMEDQRLREKEMEMVDAREREKIETELVLQVMEMNLKYKTQETVANVRAQAEAAKQHKILKVTHNDAGQVETLEIQHHGTDQQQSEG